MAKKKKLAKVKIPADAGKKWWHIPEGFWKDRVREERLHQVMDEYILPLLMRLESLIPNRKTSFFKGKTIVDIEANPGLVQGLLYFLDLALAEDLLVFEGGKGVRAQVGATGLTIIQVRNHYLVMAAKSMVKGMRGAKPVLAYIAGHGVSDLAQLPRFKAMAKFHPAALAEMRIGFREGLDPVMEKDDAYLAVLAQCHPVHFMRALRVGLEDEFPLILQWSPEFVKIVADSLDHSSKVVALGKSLIYIQDPAIIVALGKWPTKEVPAQNKKGRKWVARIGQIKELLGDEFEKILGSSPDLLAQVGEWTDSEVEEMKFYFTYIKPPVLEALSPLEFNHQIGILNGLWDRLGREFMEGVINKPRGLKGVQGIVGMILEMIERDSAPKDVREMIKKDYFNKFTDKMASGI